MDRHAVPIPREEAFAILDGIMADRRLPAGTVPAAEARGRVLATAVCSALDLPPFDRASMDGYALPEGDGGDRFRLVQTIPAGHPGGRRLEAGCAVKIMTGAPVPPGADRVVRVEYTREEAGQVVIEQADPTVNISPRGVDLKRGQEILAPGTVVGAVELSNLIACAVETVEVIRRPRVAILSTGDEIVDRPADLGPGKIMNSNGPMLAALAADHGLEVVDQRAIADDAASTRQAISRACDEADLVILSGGVSVGDYDYVLDAFADLGLTVHFSRLAIKPGKPTVFCTSPDKVLFGLPGNPVSVFVQFHLFVLRALDWMRGTQVGMREFDMRLGKTYRRKLADRLGYVPSRITPAGELEALEFHGSAHQAALIQADGFFQIALGEHELPAGTSVRFMPLHCGRR